MSAAARGPGSRRSPVGEWLGRGSTSVLPPLDYWRALAETMPSPQLTRLRALSDERVNEIAPSDLTPPEPIAIALLDRVAADGWFTRTTRARCPNCDFPLSDEEAAQPPCPNCGEDYDQHGGVKRETVYVRALAPVRVVDWVVAIHGMNTSGTWQESFSWLLGTTWGRSVPVAVYKFGIVIAGVVMAWRRRAMRNTLRDRLATLQQEARAHGFTGRPDVVAHSFGTWLFGHLLEEELLRSAEDRLEFGRVILAGCILRPDFDWARMKAAGLVEDVLNHYGTADAIVPLAHMTISDSGPSGRRGFDGDQVINIRAEGVGHSNLFDISHLEQTYTKYWRPFLMFPRAELTGLPDRVDPQTRWRARPWLLRAPAFGLAVLLLVLLIAAIVSG